MVAKDLYSWALQVALDSSQCGSLWVVGHRGRGLNLSLLHPSSFLLRSDVGISTPQEFPVCGWLLPLTGWLSDKLLNTHLALKRLSGL